MSEPVLAAIVWLILIVLLGTPVLRLLHHTFRAVRQDSPWSFHATGSHWDTGRWMTDSVFGAAGFGFMMGLAGLFVTGGLALVYIVLFGQEAAFHRVMGETVTQAAHFILTVGFLPIIGFVYAGIVLVLWKQRRQRDTGLLEAWLILPYAARTGKLGIWIGHIRRPSGEYVTVLSEITGVPPVPDKTTRWSQCSESFPVHVPQTLNPPVPVTWVWAPTLSPFVVRWERPLASPPHRGNP